MFYLGATHSAPLPLYARFGRGLGPLSGLEMHCARYVLLALGTSCWRSVAPKVLHNALRDAPRCPKGLQKLAFRPPWATLLEQIGERVAFVKNIFFIMFSSRRATPGLSTVALLTALDTECGPEPAFLCPLAPTGAPKRRRRSP